MDLLRRLVGTAPTDADIPSALKSMLCGASGESVWKQDPYDVAFITFRENGTGDLQFALQTALFITSEFRWKAGPETQEGSSTATPATDSTASEPSTHAVTSDEAVGTSPRPIGPTTIEITLTTKLSSDFQGATRKELLTNEDLLTDEAFRPRTFTVQLEHGSFAFPRPNAAGKRREYQLQIHPSPFPPRQMWKDPEGGVDANRPWEWTTFVGGAEVK